MSVDENLYYKVLDLLSTEYGLDPENSHLPEPYRYMRSTDGEDRVLVWVDERGIGRWRVRCLHDCSVRGEPARDLFLFHYWLNDERLDKDILQRDPMRPVLERVLAMAADPKPLPHMYLKKSIRWCMENLFQEERQQ